MSPDDLEKQYGSPDPLQVRIDIHKRYQTRDIDLDAESKRLLRLSGDESLLDAGCGPGQFLTYLCEHGHFGRLVGLDQSAGMIERLPSSLEGVVGDVQRLPFADGEFDWAVARHMLYHVPDIPKALEELHRVARRGVLITTNSRSNMEYFNLRINDVLRGIGEPTMQPVVERFCLENARAQLAAEGYSFRHEVLENTLSFRSARPMAAYILSCLPTYGISPVHPRYAEIEEWLEHQTEVDLAMVDFEAQIRIRVWISITRKE